MMTQEQSAEVARLIAETEKLNAETVKIQAEARYYPLIVLAAMVGSAVALSKLFV